MAQQVLDIKVHLGATDPLLDASTFGWFMEATGASTSYNPQPYLDAVQNAIMTLVGGQTNNLAHYFSTTVNGTAGMSWIQATDITTHLDGTPAGPAQWISPLTLGTSSGPTNLPEGVAAVCAWHSDYTGIPEFSGTSRPRSRHRGRCYVGPLNNAASHNGTNGRCVWTNNFIQDLLAFFFEVGQGATAHPTGGSWKQVVWSRRNQAVYEVIWWGVDDRPDYQRRRSDQPASTLMTKP